MNSILKSYFNYFNEYSENGLCYYVYPREDDMPYSVHLNFRSRNGSNYNSWGTGVNLDEGLGKALMELIERVTFSFQSPIEFKKLHSLFSRKTSLFEISKSFCLPIKFLHPSNSNGVAIHLFKRQARKSALFELIERHTILMSFLFEIGPHGSVSKVLGSKECEFFYWEGPLNTYTVVGAVKVQNGYYYSSGCSDNREEALLKAEFELNSFIHLEANWNEEKYEMFLNERSIIKDDIDSFNRYHRYSGDQRAIEFLRKISKKKIPNLSRKHFYFCDIPSPPMFHKLPKFTCSRVIHPDVQQLFFDNWDKSYINPRLEYARLPEFPHIIA